MTIDTELALGSAGQVPEKLDPPIIEAGASEFQLGSRYHTAVDRIGLLRDTWGFMPTSAGEANRAYALLGYMDDPDGAAAYLDGILAHQQRKSASKNPETAVEKVAREIGAYARKARGDTVALAQLTQELRDSRAGGSLATLGDVRLQTGTGQLVRHVDLAGLLLHGKIGIDPFSMQTKKQPAADPYTVSQRSRAMNAHVEHVLQAIPVSHASGLILAAAADQAKRRAFWTEILQQARQQAVARPIAYVALQDLGVIPRV
jgi:hypothetical protein